MTINLSFTAWKEEICPVSFEILTLDRLNELFENLNNREKNNENNATFAQWCEEYIAELPLIDPNIEGYIEY